MSPPASTELPPRQTLLLSGPDAWLAEQRDALGRHSRQHGLTSLCVCHPRSLGDAQRSLWTDCLPGRQLVRMLGRSYDRIVLDWSEHWQTNHLSQVAGALRAGGELIVLLAQQDQWRQRYAWREAGPLNYFPWWYRTLLAQGAVEFTPETIDRLPSVSLTGPPRAATRPEMDTLQPATDEQAAVVQRIVEHCSGRQSSAVLTAARGHGKTLSLVLAARALAAQGKDVVLTAALPDHLAELSYWLGSEAGTSIGLIPWEQLSTETLKDAVLLVDEAAVLGVTRLKWLVEQARHRVLATTTDGYEGSGLGFLLRFLPWLAQRDSGLLRLTLETPARWARDDPVSRQLAAALLHPQTEPSQPATGALGSPEPMSLTDSLDNPAVRDQWVRLLAEAHYQTRPDDLRQCLDNPELHAWGVWQGEQLVGLLVALEEPPLADDLAEGVWAGTRRPPDQLAKQSMVGQLGHRESARWCGLRIWRLVVHPDWQRRGIASQLVNSVTRWAEDNGCEYLAASFGLTPELAGFWRRLTYVPVRLGHRADAASGQRSLLVVRDTASHRSGEVAAWSHACAELLAEHCLLHQEQASTLPDSLLTDLASWVPAPPLTKHARSRVRHWCLSHQPEDGLHPLLALALWHACYWRPQVDRLDTAERESLLLQVAIGRLWRHEPWADIQQRLHLSDRKALQGMLRNRLLAAVAPD